MDFNIRVEFDPKPIRHIAVECPKCKKFFPGMSITNSDLSYEYQINFARFECPVCGLKFGYKGCGCLYQKDDRPIIHEMPYEEVYKDCLHKKEVWE